MPQRVLPRLKKRFAQEGDQQIADHPEAYLPFLKEFRNVLELAVLKATAHFSDPDGHPMPVGDEANLEGMLLQRLQALPAHKQQIALANLPARMERLNILSSMDFSALFEQGSLDAFATTTPVMEAAAPVLMHRAEVLRSLLTQSMSGIEVPGMMQTMSNNGNVKAILRIHKVRCVVETSSIAGDDEIVLAGVQVDANGQTRKIDSFLVADDFDDNEERVYAPPILYAQYDIVGGSDQTAFPKYIACMLILVELDNGGMDDMVYQIYQEIRNRVVSAITNAAVGQFGSLGAIVGTATGYLVGELWNLFKEIWEDDLFPPQKVDLVFHSPRSNFNGSDYSPMYTVWFRAHGGQYYIDYSWQIVGNVFSPPPPPLVQGIEGIVVYKNVNFDGDEKLLKVGTHRLGGGSVEGRPEIWLMPSKFNDEIDSIRVGEGYYAWLYKNNDFSGTPLEIHSDMPTLPDEWRDQITSIIVIKKG